jgi:L-amino acid N-acyltransferase YncA
MVIRGAREADIAASARSFPAIVAAGETCAYREDLDDGGIADLWIEAPPGRTVVAVDEDGTVLGSASMGPNRPGRDAHIATASFMVDPAAQGRGIGRAPRSPRRSSTSVTEGSVCTSCTSGCERW